MTAAQLPEFTGVLYAILKQHPDGIKEYDLIRQLTSDEVGVLEPSVDFSNPLVLFQTHFMVFHQLYRLRDELRAEQSGDLRIHTTGITLLPYEAGHAGLTEEDTLRAYYLDLSELEKTGIEDVEQLLNGFWRSMAGESSPHERQSALETLGLTEQDDARAIRRRYRQLMHQYHPDKDGGSVAKSQAITAAYQKLV